VRDSSGTKTQLPSTGLATPGRPRKGPQMSMHRGSVTARTCAIATIAAARVFPSGPVYLSLKAVRG
jgi:hypothetical protein